MFITTTCGTKTRFRDDDEIKYGLCVVPGERATRILFDWQQKAV